MEPTIRLTFTSTRTSSDLDDLWQNCFAGAANFEHINGYVPYPLTAQRQLNNFMQSAGKRYKAWIIKRRKENDIIGFVNHSDFFPGHPNNIGFNLGLNYTRQGNAAESLMSLMNFLENSGYTETYGHCFATNAASVRCMENCGFENLGPTGEAYGNDIEIQFRKRFAAFGAVQQNGQRLVCKLADSSSRKKYHLPLVHSKIIKNQLKPKIFTHYEQAPTLHLQPDHPRRKRLHGVGQAGYP